MKGALLFLVPALAVAGYSDLIAARDGSAVVFRYSNSFSTGGWYRWTPGGVVPYDGVPTPDGTVTASATYQERRCSYGGSTCFLAAPCRASWRIATPEGDLSGSMRQTELRVSPDGRFAWFQQTETVCRGMVEIGLGWVVEPARNGVYALPGLDLVEAATGRLASTAPGARVFTPSGTPLLLEWSGRLSLGASKLTLPTLVVEATMDEAGTTVAWQDPSSFVWVTNGNPFGGPVLMGPGRSPRLSDDGRTLAFLGEGDRIQIRRPLEGTRTAGALASEIALSGDGQWLFSIDPDGHLVRTRVETMESTRIVPRVFDGFVWTARVAPMYCPLPCYNWAGYIKAVAGQILILRGRGFDGEGWTVAVDRREIPLQRLADDQVWFMLPPGPQGSQSLRFFNHGHPVEFMAATDPDYHYDLSVGCFGFLYPDGAPVTRQRPAAVGDIVLLFTTGVYQSFAARPPIFEQLWEGPAPGLDGIRQRNLRVLRVPEPENALFFNQSPSCSMPPIRP